MAARAAGKVVVAVDVLRATTTLVAAFANGAAQAVPVRSPEEAWSVKATRFPDALMGGERQSVRIDGFDLSNSPREYTREAVLGRTLVFTTTNGTGLLRTLESAVRVVLGALINVDAVCDVVADEPADLLIACAGHRGRVTMEDVLCAGACVSRLRDRYETVDAASRAAELLWNRFGDDALDALSGCEHGSGLAALGLGEDLVYATGIGRTDIVPEVVDGLIRVSERRRTGVEVGGTP